MVSANARPYTSPSSWQGGEVRNQSGDVAGPAVQAGMIRDVHVYADGRAVVPDPLALAAQRLATSVGRQWTEEAGFRSLLRPEPLRLRWSTTDRPVVLGEMSDQPVRRRGDRHQLVAVLVTGLRAVVALLLTGHYRPPPGSLRPVSKP